MSICNSQYVLEWDKLSDWKPEPGVTGFADDALVCCFVASLVPYTEESTLPSHRLRALHRAAHCAPVRLPDPADVKPDALNDDEMFLQTYMVNRVGDTYVAPVVQLACPCAGAAYCFAPQCKCDADNVRAKLLVLSTMCRQVDGAWDMQRVNSLFPIACDREIPTMRLDRVAFICALAYDDMYTGVFVENALTAAIHWPVAELYSQHEARGGVRGMAGAAAASEDTRTKTELQLRREAKDLRRKHRVRATKSVAGQEKRDVASGSSQATRDEDTIRSMLAAARLR